MVGYHRETHHFREEKSTKELTAPQHTRFTLPLTSPDKIHRCAAWAVFFFYGHLSGRRPLHLANARPFGRSKAPLGLLLLRKRGILLSEETKNPNPSPIEKRFGFSLFGAPENAVKSKDFMAFLFFGRVCTLLHISCTLYKKAMLSLHRLHSVYFAAQKLSLSGRGPSILLTQDRFVA